VGAVTVAIVVLFGVLAVFIMVAIITLMKKRKGRKDYNIK